MRAVVPHLCVAEVSGEPDERAATRAVTDAQQHCVPARCRLRKEIYTMMLWTIINWYIRAYNQTSSTCTCRYMYITCQCNNYILKTRTIHTKYVHQNAENILHTSFTDKPLYTGPVLMSLGPRV